MRRSFYKYVFLTLSAAAAVFLPDISFAVAQDKPLMIIRFTGDSVPYQHTLGKAVKIALAAKPSVLFDLVAIFPETESKKDNKVFADKAKSYVENVAYEIKQSGVSPDMIRTSYQTNKFSKNEEIQIFVQ